MKLSASGLFLDKRLLRRAVETLLASTLVCLAAQFTHIHQKTEPPIEEFILPKYRWRYVLSFTLAFNVAKRCPVSNIQKVTRKCEAHRNFMPSLKSIRPHSNDQTNLNILLWNLRSILSLMGRILPWVRIILRIFRCRQLHTIILRTISTVPCPTE